MPSRNTCRFRPLRNSDSIRLLRLAPSAVRSADLFGQLVEVDKTQNMKYEALSYVWGKEDFAHVLHLEGGNTLTITENLDTALRRLRFQDRERTLWIDAVCIDQSNLAEKGPQVENMANIYRNAAQVVAWLGEPPSGDDGEVDEAAIIDLAKMAGEIGLQGPADDLQALLNSWVYGIKERSDRVLRIGEQTLAAHFPSLYQSAWFTRMWIVQEAVLASKLFLFYGDKKILWQDFEQTVLLLKATQLSIRHPVPNPSQYVLAWSLVEIQHHWIGRQRECDPPDSVDLHDMSFYMQSMKGRDCKDARDRIFALRGLVSGPTALVLKPDYTKNVNVVYTEYAREMLRRGHIEILYHAGLWKRTPYPPKIWPDYLPTWVPDYRKETTIRVLEIKFGSRFGLDTGVEPSFDLSLQPFRLGAKATLIDIVNFVQQRPTFLYDETVRFNHIALFLKMRELCLALYLTVFRHFQDNNFEYPTGGHCVSALAHALVGGGLDRDYLETFGARNNGDPFGPLELWQIYDRQCLEPTGEVFQALKREAEKNITRSPEEPTHYGLGFDFYNDASKEAGVAWDYLHHIVKVMTRHWIFMTCDGYIGLGPPQTETDLSQSIAFIDGGNVPFSLREMGANGDWALIGPCYLHGLMDGRAVKEDPRFENGRGIIHLV
ncbi:heterokaryon incompatibility protein-domain-containing protein [Podospora aff. communis PSN243]|uniref:Heterokaryon incompatibility protein-domain-containing protein n=1 Tax=Podospora aff. communis PSN243 TaxID=3040156 RepID=A0AAV9GKN5_9PEZI|nr:heterokaryon incompatibility protein-domain-containing protein [Podospora aff. communis PSN243]